MADIYYAHVQTSNAYNFCWSGNLAKPIRMFDGHFFKGYHMKIQNDAY